MKLCGKNEVRQFEQTEYLPSDTRNVRIGEKARESAWHIMDVKHMQAIDCVDSHIPPVKMNIDAVAFEPLDERWS